MDKYLEFRIDCLLKQIETIENDLMNKTLPDFKQSDLLVRATCFSMSQIGEQMNKMQKELEPLYPNFPWQEARKMRTLIVHIYNKVDAEQIYLTAVNDLPILKEEFLKVKKDLFDNN